MNVINTQNTDLKDLSSSSNSAYKNTRNQNTVHHANFESKSFKLSYSDFGLRKWFKKFRRKNGEKSETIL